MTDDPRTDQQIISAPPTDVSLRPQPVEGDAALSHAHDASSRPAAALTGMDDPSTDPSAIDDDNTRRMSLGDHLEELRRRLFFAALGLVAAMVLALVFGERMMEWIEWPYYEAYRSAGIAPPAIMVTDVSGAFTMYLKLAFYAGLVLSAPWVFYQLWMFIGAGLYKREQRYVLYAVPFSVVLFVLGVAFGVYVSVPAVRFFVVFGNDMHVDTRTTLDNYVSFMTSLLLVFGLIFQVPLVVLVLSRVGLVSRKLLTKYRRHVIVAMAVVAAFVAPPDALSMILMVVPMWLLYELGILLSWWLVFRKQPAGEQDELDEPQAAR